MRLCPRCSLRYPDDRERCFVDGASLGDPEWVPALARAGYRLGAVIGSGRLGPVFQAKREPSGTPCALRVLRDVLFARPGVRRAFLDAGRRAQPLAHPNLVGVIDVGETPEFAFIVAQLVTGHTLARELERAPMSRPIAIRVAAEVARALVALHSHGLVHADLRPENVFLTSSGRVKVGDFGLSLTLPSAGPLNELMHLTERSAFGTPYYPVSNRGPRGAPAADAYALGALVFQLVAHRLPYAAETLVDGHILRATEPVPHLRDVVGDVPEALDRLTFALMAQEPTQRVPLHEALDELEALAPQGI